MGSRNQRDVARDLLLRTAPKQVEAFDKGELTYDEAVGVALEAVCDRLDALEDARTDPEFLRPDNTLPDAEPSEPAPATA